MFERHNSEGNVESAIGDPRELFIMLNGVGEGEVDLPGFTVTIEKEGVRTRPLPWYDDEMQKEIERMKEEIGEEINIEEERDVIGYDSVITLKREEDGKKLILVGVVDHRFNGGSEPVEISVRRNDFSGEELNDLKNKFQCAKKLR